MADEWQGIERGKQRFEAQQRKVDTLWSGLRTLIVEDAPLDEGITLTKQVLHALDRLLCDVFAALHRGADSALLKRAEQLVRMKRRAWTVLQRYADRLTAGLGILSITRESATDVDDSRALLAHARMRHIEALAS